MANRKPGPYKYLETLSDGTTVLREAYRHETGWPEDTPFVHTTPPPALPPAAPGSPPPGSPPPSMNFSEALFYKRGYGNNAVLPPDMRKYTLEELREKAAEEQRPAREKREAADTARRLEATRQSLARALAGPPKRRTPARLRACFLRQLERWGTFSQASAAIDLDERTLRRWRRNDPRFEERCREALAGRRQLLEDDCVARARAPRVRPFFFGGKKVGEVTTYNDNLLLKTLDRLNGNEARSQRAAPALDPAAFATALAASLAPILSREMKQVLAERPGAEMSGRSGQAESGPTPLS